MKRRPKYVEERASRYGYKARVFVACDDGSRICIMCLQDVCRLDQYGPIRKDGRCYHCDLTVRKES